MASLHATDTMAKTPATHYRFAQPLWGPDHPDRLALDRRLAPDHRARRLDYLVATLDLTPLHQAYAGTGSLAHPPDRLLCVLLYETHCGRHQPAQWHRDAHESEPVRWLLRGCQPARSCWYAFRDRLPPDALQHWQRQVLQHAQDEDLTPARRGALDGTAVAANASRHRLLSEKPLQQRLQQLAAAVAADASAVAAVAAAPVVTVAAPVATVATVHATPPATSTPALAPDTAPALAATTPDDHPPAATAATVLAATLLPLLCIATPASSSAAPPTAAVPAGDTVTTATPSPTPTSTPVPPRSQPGWMATTPRGRTQQQARYQRAADRLAQAHQRNQQKRSCQRQRRDRIVVSPSDPEAALGLDKERVFRPLYNLQLLDDLDSPFVLAYAVVAQPNDAGLLGPLLTQAQQTLGHALNEVLVDGGYVGGADLAAAEQAQVAVYGAPPPVGQNGSGLFTKARFHFVAAEQVYACPAGKRLVPVSTTRQARSSPERVTLTIYQAAPADCQACPLAAQCTRSPATGRSVSRSEHEEWVEALRTRMAGAEAKELYRLRRQTVELANADLKQHRELRRLSGRGRRRAQVQVGLCVLAHNLVTWWSERAKAKARRALTVNPPGDSA